MAGPDRPRRFLVVLAGACVVGFGLLTLGPLPVRILDAALVALRSMSRLLPLVDDDFPARWQAERLLNVLVPAVVGWFVVSACRIGVLRLSAVAVMGFAAVELFQRWLPGRDPSVRDAALNSLGFICGVTASVARRRRRDQTRRA